VISATLLQVLQRGDSDHGEPGGILRLHATAVNVAWPRVPRTAPRRDPAITVLPLPSPSPTCRVPLTAAGRLPSSRAGPPADKLVGKCRGAMSELRFADPVLVKS